MVHSTVELLISTSALTHEILVYTYVLMTAIVPLGGGTV